MSSTTIREMPEDERPRERLARLGPGALSEAELIAVLLRTGIAGTNAIQLAAELLKEHGGLTGLARCSVGEISRRKGIGFAKACHLVAAFGLGARLARGTIGRQKIDTPEIVYELLGPELSQLRVESLRVIVLDTRYHLIECVEVSKGSVSESIAHPREILRPVLLRSASAFLLAHNHPSGDPSPSEADLRLTRRIAEAANLFQVTLLDHVIIGMPSAGSPGYYSFKEAGLL